MKLPASVLRQFREAGKRGGETSAKHLTAAERKEKARRAALARWKKGAARPK